MVLVFYYCHAIVHIITVLVNANIDSMLVISEISQRVGIVLKL